MSQFSKKLRHGFTLVEIMIVVLIIGILLAIAVPNFVKARESSRAKSCVANLKQIESAKEQFAMDKRKADGAAVTEIDIVGAELYLKTAPTCPSDGKKYTLGNIGAAPKCLNDESTKDESMRHALPSELAAGGAGGGGE